MLTFDDYIDSPQSVAEVSLDGRWLRANHSLCQLLGYTESELQGLRVRDLTHPEDRAFSVTIVDTALRHHEQAQEELKRYVRKDCQVVWALLKTTLWRDPQGEPTHFLSFLEDVSERVHHEPLSRALARRLQATQDLERQRLARELHDELAQILASLRLELGWLQARLPKKSQTRTERLSVIVDGLLASVRRLWSGLRPSILDELGLEAALDWLLQETCGLNGIPWTFQAAEGPLRLDSQTRGMLFRVCQEGLGLLLADAQASQVEVKLQQLPDELQLSVAATRETPPVRNGRLLSMQDQAQLFGGLLRLDASTLLLSIPVVRPSQDRRQVPPHWE